jgi:hypothetical protein
MCPIWPLHLIILYLLALCPIWVLCQQLPAITLEALFEPNATTLHMDDVKYVNLTVKGNFIEGALSWAPNTQRLAITTYLHLL